MADHRTRRGFLIGSGAVAVSAVGLAGCTGTTGSGGSANNGSTSGGAGDTGSANNSSGTSSEIERLDSLTIGNATHFGNMQHYVMRKHGAYDEITKELSVQQFTSGPKMVKGFISGSLDMINIGVSPTFVIQDKASKGTIPIASTKDGLRAMSTNEFAKLYKQKKGDAFAAFEEKHGRKLRIGSAPPGSVPDVIIRYWIEKDLDLGDVGSVVTQKRVPPEKTAQAMQSGELDATMIHEPYATVINNDSGFSQAEWSGDILPGHPVKVVLVNDRVFDNTPAVKALVNEHINATKFANENPKKAAKAALKYMGIGIDQKLAFKAMKAPTMDLISNPHTVTKQAGKMAEYVASVGNTSSVIEPDQVFDTGAYDSVAGGSTTQ